MSLLAAALLTACAQSAPPEVTPRRVTRQKPTVPALSDRAWRWVESQRFLLELPLPDGSSWRVDDASERWLVARHDASDSVLWARGWRAEGVVNREGCEREARLFRRDLPSFAEGVVDERVLGVPEGFDTAVRVVVRSAPAGEALEGYAVAFGANVRRCVALVYLTRETGTGAESRLGERLEMVVDGVFARVRSRSIDDRARQGR